MKCAGIIEKGHNRGGYFERDLKCDGVIPVSKMEIAEEGGVEEEIVIKYQCPKCGGNFICFLHYSDFTEFK